MDDPPFLPLLCGYRGSYEPREPWLYEREFRQILTVERDSRQVVVAGRQRKRGEPVPETRACASTSCGKTFSVDPRRPRATCSERCSQDLRVARGRQTVAERQEMRRQVLAKEAASEYMAPEQKAKQRAAIARGLAETRENLRRLYRQAAGS